MKYQNELETFGRETETTRTDLAEARARWDAGRLDRVRRQSAGRREPSFGFPARLGLAGAALAAAALLLFQLRPGPVDDGPVAFSEGEAVDLAFAEGINITGSAEAVIGGVEGAREIDLTSGGLRFEVTPHQGLHVGVRTEEARVQVLGTVFTVDRDGDGTRVGVERGKVQVDCVGEGTRIVTAEQSATCLSAQGYLRRGRELLGSASGEALLEAIAPAQQLPASVEVRSGLESLSISALLSAERYEPALSRAESYLADPALRGVDADAALQARQVAASAAMKVGGCERALTHLEALRAGGAALKDNVQYAACVKGDDPAAARAALEDALSQAPDEATAARIQALLDKLE